MCLKTINAVKHGKAKHPFQNRQVACTHTFVIKIQNFLCMLLVQIYPQTLTGSHLRTEQSILAVIKPPFRTLYSLTNII